MDYLDYCGIYEIFNSISGDRYIGSSHNIRLRFSNHKSLLRSNKHHSTKLQRAFNKYGESIFIFRLISKCDINIQFILEQFYLNSMKPRYNISINTTSPMKYRKHNEATIKTMKGRAAWNKGIPRTDEEKAYISYKRKIAFNNQSIEQKEKCKARSVEFLKTNKPFKGKHHTEENKILLRKGFIDKFGQILCNETGKTYETQLDAALDLGIRQGHISEHLQGKRKTASKYTFKPYVENKELTTD